MKFVPTTKLDSDSDVNIHMYKQGLFCNGSVSTIILSGFMGIKAVSSKLVKLSSNDNENNPDFLF